jgi:hypothetical protein
LNSAQTGVASADKQVRRNGYTMMSMMAGLINPKEETKDALDFKSALTILLKGVDDAEFSVRSTAWESLQEFCGKPELPAVDHHAAIMKAVFGVLERKDASGDEWTIVIAKCLLAATELVDTAVEGKPPRVADVQQYLEPLMKYAMASIRYPTLSSFVCNTIHSNVCL